MSVHPEVLLTSIGFLVVATPFLLGYRQAQVRDRRGGLLARYAGAAGGGALLALLPAATATAAPGPATPAVLAACGVGCSLLLLGTAGFLGVVVAPAAADR